LIDLYNNKAQLPADILQGIIDASASVLLLVDKKSQILFANKAVVTIFGHEASDIIGEPLHKLLLPTNRQKHVDYVADFFSKMQDREMGQGASFPAQHKNGGTIYVSIDLHVVTYEGQECVLATITKAKRLNDATRSLEKSRANLASKINQNKRLLDVAQNSKDAVFILNDDQKITWVNTAGLSMMNMRLREIQDVNFLKFLGSKTNRVEKTNLRRALVDGLSFTGDLFLSHKGMTTVQVDCTVQPVFESDFMQGFTVIAKDVTSRRMLEAQMRENNELLETTARIANLGFYSLDILTNELTWSEEVFAIHELPNTVDIKVEDAINYYAPESRPLITKAVERCMETGEAFDLELAFITAKNNRIWVRSVGYAEFSSGKPVKLKGAFQDITHMRQAALDAEQAVNAKSNFLANMSHELRTPISGVLGLCEVLSATELQDKQTEYLGMIARSADSLLFLVNQVLDFAKLNDGSQVLNKSSFSLSKLMQDTIYIHQLKAQGKGLEFLLKVEKDVPDNLYTDPDRLAQVIHNLCSNSIKFTEVGNVTLHIKLDESKAVLFSVIDTGVGIKDKDKSRLFTEFQQVDSTYSRQHQGTGLGLTISKQLVTLMQGQMGFFSTFEKGSTFWFSIPCEESPETEVFDTSLTVLPNTIVLTPDEATYNIWGELAVQHSIKLKAVKNLAQVINTVKSTSNWEIVVLPFLPDDIPIATSIASILRVLKDDQRFILDSKLYKKWQETLDKPLSAYRRIYSVELLPDNNQSTLRATCSWQYAAIQKWYVRNQHVDDKDLSTKRVLIAEDNEINQILFEELLKDTELSITIANNGKEAIEALKQDSNYDFVIMDCQMPVVDGFEATKTIRGFSDNKLANIRIAAATAHGFKEDIQKCFDAGMNDVLVKPFSKEQLIAMIMRNV
jgi:PAS domain S-box-containing protein